MMITARARCARISATYSRSPGLAFGRAGQADQQLQRMRDIHQPGAIDEKYGSAMSCTTTPTMEL